MDDTCFELDVQQLMVGYLKDFQQTLSELESSFRDIEDSKEIIKGALQAAGMFYAADRAYVLEIDMDLHIGVNTYEWCSEDAPAELIHSQRIPLELIPRLEVCLKQNEAYIFHDGSSVFQAYKYRISCGGQSAEVYIRSQLFAASAICYCIRAQ